MTEETWSVVEVSAYLDGELEPQRQDAFEAAIERDPNLRRRVQEMEGVVAMVRAAPQREAPRNYLLTPAMVEDAKPQSKRRRAGLRMPLLVMRLATSLVTLAFVATFGLTLLQQGYLPSAMAPTAVDEASEAPWLMAPEPESRPAPELEAADVQTEALSTDAEATVAVEEELAAPMPEADAPREVGEDLDPEEMEKPVGILEAEPIEELPAEAEDTAEIESEALERAPAPEVEEAEPAHVSALTRRIRPPLWLSIGLGSMAVVMIGITVWLSRRELG